MQDKILQQDAWIEKRGASKNDIDYKSESDVIIHSPAEAVQLLTNDPTRL